MASPRCQSSWAPRGGSGHRQPDATSWSIRRNILFPTHELPYVGRRQAVVSIEQRWSEQVD